MSLVGFRPCLFNQTKLISYREINTVFAVLPGVTGLAQVRGIDMSTPELLATTDKEMIKEISVTNYFKYILQTLH